MSAGFQAIGQAVRKFMSWQNGQGKRKVKRPKWGLGWCPVCQKTVDSICWNSLVCRNHCAETGGCDVCRPRTKV